MMDVQTFVQGTLSVLSSYLPRLAGAIGVLVVGWLVALVLARIVRGLLLRTEIDNRLAAWVSGGAATGPTVNIERLVSKGVFYLAMLFVLLAFFQTLGLTLITEPLNRMLTEVFAFAPRVLSAGALLVAAWGVATIARTVVVRTLTTARIDQRLGERIAPAGGTAPAAVSFAAPFGDALYWLVFVLFLPAVLGALALEGILEPVRNMLDEALRVVPNLFAAAIIFAVGWFFARVVRQVVTAFLAAAGLDAVATRAGLSTVLGPQKLSGIVGLLAYVLILVPTLITALNALELDAVTAPASDMLARMLAAVPALTGAALVLSVAYVVGRLVATLVTNVLTGLGFNSLLTRVGLRTSTDGTRSPAAVAGKLVLIGIMLFAAAESATMLGFATVTTMLAEFMLFTGHIVMGLVILAVGLYLAELAARAISTSQLEQASILAASARIAIVVLASAMALRQMGLASDIINLAFGLVLGSVAAALAIAFGFGGRDFASRQLDSWAERFHRTRSAPEQPRP